MNIYGQAQKGGLKVLQKNAKTIILTVKDGFVACPHCRRNKKLQRIPPDMEATNFPAYCPDCKHESILNIARGQRVELRSP